MKTEVWVYRDVEQLAAAGAEMVAKLVFDAQAKRGRCTLVLAGGSTPAVLYRRLACSPLPTRIDWDKVFLFWGDERCVSPEDPRSNYRMVHENLLRHAPVPQENVFRIPCELPAERAAEEYEIGLRQFFAGQGGADVANAPAFDVVLLGLGDDGHVASLFPGSHALTEHSRWVVAVYVEKLDAWRVTLTPAALNAARNVIFYVSGAAKGRAVRNALEEPYDPLQRPAQVVRPTSGDVYWLLDEPAAMDLRDVVVRRGG